ncbi:hypothetical protein GQ44DRAFT_677916, partial [Phaeosphaeriaceae sp. PMI808]
MPAPAIRTALCDHEQYGEAHPHQQQITGVSTENKSQAFVGSARDVFFNSSKDQQDNLDQAARECRSALFLSDPEADREKVRSAKGTRVAGTCEWITQNQTYHDWLEDDTHVLWISGGPGKGKTMMSVFLTEELERRHGTASLLFYFCNHQDEKHNNGASLLRSLIYQIITKRPKLIKHVLPHFETVAMKQQALSSLETLWIIFGKL